MVEQHGRDGTGSRSKHCAPFECPVEASDDEASDDEASDDAEPIEASAAGWHTAAAARAAADSPPLLPRLNLVLHTAQLIEVWLQRPGD
jgi:hypothetical protein